MRGLQWVVATVTAITVLYVGKVVDAEIPDPPEFPEFKLHLEESYDLESWSSVPIDEGMLDEYALRVAQDGDRKFWRLRIELLPDDTWPVELTVGREPDRVWSRMEIIHDHRPSVLEAIEYMRQIYTIQRVGVPGVDRVTDELFERLRSRAERGALEVGDVYYTDLPVHPDWPAVVTVRCERDEDDNVRLVGNVHVHTDYWIAVADYLLDARNIRIDTTGDPVDWCNNLGDEFVSWKDADNTAVVLLERLQAKIQTGVYRAGDRLTVTQYVEGPDG